MDGRRAARTIRLLLLTAFLRCLDNLDTHRVRDDGRSAAVDAATQWHEVALRSASPQVIPHPTRRAEAGRNEGASILQLESTASGRQLPTITCCLRNLLLGQVVARLLLAGNLEVDEIIRVACAERSLHSESLVPLADCCLERSRATCAPCSNILDVYRRRNNLHIVERELGSLSNHCSVDYDESTAVVVESVSIATLLICIEVYPPALSSRTCGLDMGSELGGFSGALELRYCSCKTGSPPFP